MLRACDKPINHPRSKFDTLFCQLDQDLENTTLYDTMQKLGQSLNENTQKHNMLLGQQSKVLWLQQGGSNTKFFYAKMSMCRHRNKTHALLGSQGSYIYDCNCIKDTTLDYYQQLFNEDMNLNIPHIDIGMQINSVGQKYLSTSITLVEIKEALFSINDAKSPGPDGFSVKFYKFHWDDLLGISGFHYHQITSTRVIVFPYYRESF